MGQYRRISIYTSSFSLSHKGTSFRIPVQRSKRTNTARVSITLYYQRQRDLCIRRYTRTNYRKRGNLIILFPGQWHTYSPDTATGWNEYYIGFEGNFIDQLIKNGFLSKQEQVLEIGLNEGLAALLQALEVSEF